MADDENEFEEAPPTADLPPEETADESADVPPEDETDQTQNLSIDDIDVDGADSGDIATEELLGTEEQEEPMHNAKDLEAVYDIPVQLSAVLGKASMQVSQLLKLGRGAVVELDRKVGEAIDIYVNNRLVARGEVVVVDERLGITMTEIIKSDRTN